MLLATALALLITGCLSARRLLFKNNRQQQYLKKTITHHFFVSGIGQKKTVDVKAKICGGAENVVKTETQQTFVNGLLGFITLGIYTAGSVCSSLILRELPTEAATLSALLINILSVPSSCFWYRISFSEGENNPVQRCLPVGRLLSYAGGGVLHALTDRPALMCNWRRPAATSSRRASFSALYQ